MVQILNACEAAFEPWPLSPNPNPNPDPNPDPDPNHDPDPDPDPDPNPNPNLTPPLYPTLSRALTPDQACLPFLIQPVYLMEKGPDGSLRPYHQVRGRARVGEGGTVRVGPHVRVRVRG